MSFKWPSPLAQRNDLHAVKGTPDGARIWAVGASGTVLSLRGDEATLEATATLADLHDVWVGGPDDIWIVGDGGTILHSDGKKWSLVRSGTKQHLNSIWGRSAQDLWIGGDDGTLLHRAGKTFRSVPTPTKGPIAGVVGCEKGEVCALTLASILPRIDTSSRPCHDPNGECLLDEPQEPEGDRVLRWSGGRWLRDFFPAGPDARRLVTAGTVLWVTGDALIAATRGGKSEPSVYLPKDTGMVQLEGAWASSDADGWLVGARCTQARPPAGDFTCNRGAIWHFDGRTASLRKEEPPGPLIAVWGWSKQGAVAVGKLGTLVRFDGASWTAVSRPLTNVDLRGVVNVPAVRGTNDKSPILFDVKEHEKGPPPRTATITVPGLSHLTWALPRPAGTPLVQPSPAELWLIADCEALRANGPNWVTFVAQDCEAGAAPQKIFSADTGDVWMLPSGMTSPSRWTGRSWTTVRSASPAFPRDIWGSRGDDIWIVGGRDALHWDGRALAATAPLPGMEAADELTSVWGSDAKNVWTAAASGEGVKLLRWDGERWQPAGAFRLELPLQYRQNDSKNAYSLWPPRSESSRQLVLWGTSASDVWLAGPNGIVMRFDGSRWSRVPTPTRHPLFGLGGTRGRVVAVGAAGTILEIAPAPIGK